MYHHLKNDATNLNLQKYNIFKVIKEFKNNFKCICLKKKKKDRTGNIELRKLALQDMNNYYTLR